MVDIEQRQHGGGSVVVVVVVVRMNVQCIDVKLTSARRARYHFGYPRRCRCRKGSKIALARNAVLPRIPTVICPSSLCGRSIASIHRRQWLSITSGKLSIPTVVD